MSQLVTTSCADPPRRTMKILLVEDEGDLRTGLQRSLEEQGYVVDEAGDGEVAIHLATENDYDAIVLDVMLPKADGWQVLHRVRGAKKTPVLMLTSRRSLDDRVRGLDAGADDYLTKPFDLVEVHARLRALIRRSHGQAEPTLRFGRVTVDTAKRFVILDGRPVDLTPREYSLIEYLAFRHGHVVTRAELYEHLFADENESFSNLLDVHVCNVRKKIDKDFLQTHRGHGYALTAV